MQNKAATAIPLKNVCCIDALSLSLFDRLAPWFLGLFRGAARFCWIAINPIPVLFVGSFDFVTMPAKVCAKASNCPRELAQIALVMNSHLIGFG